MKKFLIMAVILFIAAGAGYSYLYQKPEVKAKIQEKKLQADTALLAGNIIKAQTPAEVKKALKDNEAVVNDLKEKGYVRDKDIQSFTKLVDQMEEQGEPFNRVKVLEYYGKGKLAPDKYEQVENILRKQDIGTSDLIEIATIVKGTK